MFTALSELIKKNRKAENTAVAWRPGNAVMWQGNSVLV